MVLLLDGDMGFCNGALGTVDRSLVSLMEDALMPRCPGGDREEDWADLLHVIQLENGLLVQLMLDSLPSSTAGKLATYLLEAMKHASINVRQMLQLLIRHEVKNTSEFQMLFRGNTAASKVLSQFAKMAGSKYLDLLMRPLIRSTAMMAHEAVDFFEYIPLNPPSNDNDDDKDDAAVDGAGGNGNDDENAEVELSAFFKSSTPQSPRETSSEEHTRLEKNAGVAASVWQSTEMLLDALFNSVNQVPPLLRAAAQDMHEIAVVKFADYHLVLAGFYVLRFIAPAVAAPSAFGLDCCRKVTLTAGAKKRLLQVSKVVQAVANNQPFKESSHLAILNPNVSAANTRLRSFFDQLIFDNSSVEGADDWDQPVDPQVMESFWHFSISALPLLARRVHASTDPATVRVFSALVDTLTGLPMSRK